MGLHPAGSRRRFGFLAAFVLVFFAAAQSLCFSHCYLAGGSDKGRQASCHSAGGTRRCHNSEDSSQSPSPGKSTSCITLKNLALDSSAGPQLALELSFLYVLEPEIEQALLLRADALYLRQLADDRMLFTREVCLGPAHRSLAPPRFS